ncbi:arginine--tRNA ligase [Mycoplasmopsis felis]|uniref:Arginine--tRNA ligase n=1 Tax=Mycoplasmopsis felis TaxID=33923 RepID=A0A809RT94_9BACT|nr:arginine--tRNA ligase [Mycoplasmopsis felis]BBU47542.1 arginine--tRNA ligase [Mycoplasmopsis felis]
MTIIQRLKENILEIIKKIQDENYFDSVIDFNNLNFLVNESNLNNNDISYDYSTNIAFILKQYKKTSPMEIAKVIQNELLKSKWISKIDIAQPGFLNIVLSDIAFIDIINNIVKERDNYGKNIIQKQKINVEYVSANPTGYLHVGHVRGAVYGSTLVNIYKHAGHNVESEYYVNDAGHQIEILVNSLLVRYKELFNIFQEMPTDCYKGNDIIYVAKIVKEKYGDYFLEINETKYNKLKKIAVDILLDKIKYDLECINVKFDTFTSEKSILDNNLIKPVLDKLSDNLYKKDGALYLNTTQFGDDKDRVLIKSNGNNTYLLPDIAYHLTKLLKSDKLINIWGADHSGYIARMKIALKCMGYEPDKLDILTIELVKLMKNGEEFKMSKRSGTSVTLSDLLEVSKPDAIRFMMLTREISNNFIFDIDYANSNDTNNPVYIVQYGYSRAVSLLNKLKKPNINKGIIFSSKAKKVLLTLDQFPDLIKSIVNTSKVNLLTQYLVNLVKKFNSFYEETRLQNHEYETSYASLVLSYKLVMNLGLSLLGISAPKTM